MEGVRPTNRKWLIVLVLVYGIVQSVQSARPAAAGCGRSGILQSGEEDLSNLGRDLQQYGSDFYTKKACTWDKEAKTCRIALSALGNFYSQLPEELSNLAFSVQDCSPVGSEDDCSEKARPGCQWTKSGRCESVLLAGLKMTTLCYGAAQNIFFKNCESKENRNRKSNCENADRSAGCVWVQAETQRYDPCSFSTTNFIEDMKAIAKKSKGQRPSVVFSDEHAETIASYDANCPNADEVSCSQEETCVYETEVGCVPRPSAIMRLANITREEETEEECSIVDLVRFGECTVALSIKDCLDLGDSCFWDNAGGKCFPGPTSVFEVAAAGKTKLLASFKAAKDACEELESEADCDAQVN